MAKVKVCVYVFICIYVLISKNIYTHIHILYCRICDMVIIDILSLYIDIYILASPYYKVWVHIFCKHQRD